MKTEKHEYDWGIIVNFRQQMGKGKKPQEENPLTADATIVVDILLHIQKVKTEDDGEANIPCPPGEVSNRVIIILMTNNLNSTDGHFR